MPETFSQSAFIAAEMLFAGQAASAESELADAPSRVEGRDPGKVADRFFAVNLEHVSCACVSHITMPYNCIFSLYIYFHWQYTCIYMFMALSEWCACRFHTYTYIYIYICICIYTYIYRCACSAAPAHANTQQLWTTEGWCDMLCYARHAWFYPVK